MGRRGKAAAMTGGMAIVEALVANGVEVVFGLPGAQLTSIEQTKSIWKLYDDTAATVYSASAGGNAPRHPGGMGQRWECVAAGFALLHSPARPGGVSASARMGKGIGSQQPVRGRSTGQHRLRPGREAAEGCGGVGMQGFPDRARSERTSPEHMYTVPRAGAAGIYWVDADSVAAEADY
jgi:hypothetical protein